MGNLPTEYKWLARETAPPILLSALQFYGLAEIRGPQHNPIILAWADDLGKDVGSWFNDDEKAWCALFIAHCSKVCGYLPPAGFNALRALSWMKWGEPVFLPMLGDVLVFQREGGGHVGLYVAEDKTHYHVLGGNQGNGVTIVRIDKQRLVAARRSPGVDQASIRKVVMDAKGIVSKNEA